jgi:prepilin-type N-terminal cleavage/methylation domain-containing protein
MPNRDRSGLSLLEVLISTMLIGVCLVAALRAVGMTLSTQTGLSDGAVAEALACDLLTEILAKDYQDSTQAATLQADLDERPTDKTSFDDVDDYHLWQESPPQDRQGQTIAGLTGWQRSVRVEFVEAADPTRDATSDTGLKRITVEVAKSGQLRASQSGLRGRYSP